MVGLTGRTIDDVLKGYNIRKDQRSRPYGNTPGWLLGDYQQTFPHKLYAAIMAIAITEASEGKDRLSFSDVKAYTLRAIAAVGSEEYFRGERGIKTLKAEGKMDFSSQIGEIKAHLEKVPFNVSDLERMMALELKELEGKEGNMGGMPLRMAAIEIRLIAGPAMNHLKGRRKAPYLLPTNNGSRTEFYSLVLEGSRN